MRHEIRLIAVLAIIIAGGLATVSAAYGTAGTETVEHEVQVEIVHDERITLPGTHIEDLHIQVEGGDLDEHEDYAVDRSAGQIVFLSDGSTTEGDTAELEYSAVVPTQLAEEFAAPLANVLGFVAVVVMVVAVVVLFASTAHMRRAGVGR